MDHENISKAIGAHSWAVVVDPTGDPNDTAIFIPSKESYKYSELLFTFLAFNSMAQTLGQLLARQAKDADLTDDTDDPSDSWKK